MSTATEVKVTETRFSLAAYTCLVCETKHNKVHVGFRTGKQFLICHVCSQTLEKNEAGVWETSNTIMRSTGRGPMYIEAPAAEHISKPVTVEEESYIDRYEYRCSNCNYPVTADLAKELYMPQWARHYIPAIKAFDHERHGLIGKALLKCTACQETLIEEKEGLWSVYKEGDPKKAFKPIEKRAFEIRPEIRQYLSWECACQEVNRIELLDPEGKEKEPITTLKCHSCHNTARKLKGKFVMIYPR